MGSINLYYRKHTLIPCIGLISTGRLILNIAEVMRTLTPGQNPLCDPLSDYGKLQRLCLAALVGERSSPHQAWCIADPIRALQVSGGSCCQGHSPPSPAAMLIAYLQP